MDTDSIEDHIPGLRRYAMALLRDPARADDLVQDTLERALRKFSLWRRGSSLRTWLFAIMHNQFHNQLRHERVVTQVEAAYTASGEHTSSGSTQEDDLHVRELLRALDNLHPDHREVLLLVGLEELSYRETAEVLGVPVGTVMSRLSRARERLRLALSGEGGPQLRRVK